MSKYTDGKVWKAKSEQVEIIASGERMSADPDKMATIGVTVGQQVRVTNHANNELALYTFFEEMQETYEYNARMGASGRARLSQDATPILVDVDSVVPHPTLTDAEAEQQGEFVERLDDNGAQAILAVLAPHGGMIENYTDEQAERVMQQLENQLNVTCWRCKGFKPGGGCFARWHITSTEICERSFPGLATIIDRHFAFAVAFHGCSEDGITIGGGAPDHLKQEIKAALEQALQGAGIPVYIADASSPYAGSSPANIVNRITMNGGGGIQIEQSMEARADHWQAIADAVAGVFASKL